MCLVLTLADSRYGLTVACVSDELRLFSPVACTLTVCSSASSDGFTSIEHTVVYGDRISLTERPFKNTCKKIITELQ